MLVDTYKSVIIVLAPFTWVNAIFNLGSTINREKFTVAYYWHTINFTWQSYEDYQLALTTQNYIPENVLISGIKSYKGYIYVTLPINDPGIPVTVASFPINSPKKDPLLQPYPSWADNVGESCTTLQNVQSMEIDTSGIIWIIDGSTFRNTSQCPPKIVLVDSNNNGATVQTYTLSEDICPYATCFLNDLVIDEIDGGYAYITDNSVTDPGLITYSRRQNRMWKFHNDKSMYGQAWAANFSVNDYVVSNVYNIDGIAMSPVPKHRHSYRTVFYSALIGRSIYSISTKILRDESATLTSAWKDEIKLVGVKSATSDGMIIDNKGNLYFGLIQEYSIAKWNIFRKPFNKYQRTVYKNQKTVDWPDSFGFDSAGNLYVTQPRYEQHLGTYEGNGTPPDDAIKMTVLKHHTGTRSYLYV